MEPIKALWRAGLRTKLLPNVFHLRPMTPRESHLSLPVYDFSTLPLGTCGNIHIPRHSGSPVLSRTTHKGCTYPQHETLILSMATPQILLCSLSPHLLVKAFAPALPCGRSTSFWRLEHAHGMKRTRLAHTALLAVMPCKKKCLESGGSSEDLSVWA